MEHRITRTDKITPEVAEQKLRDAVDVMALGVTADEATTLLVESQEAAGQREVLRAGLNAEWAQIASEFLYCRREDFEALGWVFHPEDCERLDAHHEIKERYAAQRYPLYSDMDDSRAKLDELDREERRELAELWGDRDRLFIRGRMPDGWRIEGMGHSMWTRFRDGDGFERASMFYKAASYDRGAHIGLTGVPTNQAQERAYKAIYDELGGRHRRRLLGVTRLAKADADQPTGPIIVTVNHYAAKEGGARDYLRYSATRVYRIDVDGTLELLKDETHDPPKQRHDA